MEHKTKTRVIFSPQLARFLAENDVYWLEAKIDTYNKDKIIFIYLTDPKIDELIAKYKEIQENDKRKIVGTNNKH